MQTLAKTSADASLLRPEISSSASFARDGSVIPGRQEPPGPVIVPSVGGDTATSTSLSTVTSISVSSRPSLVGDTSSSSLSPAVADIDMQEAVKVLVDVSRIAEGKVSAKKIVKLHLQQVVLMYTIDGVSRIEYLIE